jgi:hydroxymethylbilane synthase
MPLRLGTRASALARWQADWIAAQLRQCGIEVLLTPIATTGDRQAGAIESIGGQGVFTKEIQNALLDGRIDLAVHSLKDLPTVTPPQLCLAAVPPRAESGDVLVSAKGVSLAELPHGAVIGTGSLRRRTQLLHFRRDLCIKDIRGNIDTRLRKLGDRRSGVSPLPAVINAPQSGETPLLRFDAIVLAEAGLRRLGLDAHITEKLPLEIMLPAPGQGALALEIRSDDESTRSIVAQLDHPPTRAAVAAERAMLAALQGGCLAPIAALGQVEGDRLTLIGRVLSRDGVRRIEVQETATLAEAVALGRQVADALLSQGAGELILAARQSHV